MLIDVHAHLTHEQFKNDLPSVIKRASKMIVLCAGSGHRDNQAVMKICALNSNVLPSLGFYPWDCVTLSEEEIDFAIDYIRGNASKIVCIGEVGLDYHWGEGKQDLEKQDLTFNKMLELGLDIKKPVLIHCRKAEKEVLKTILDYDGSYIIHSYTGPKNLVSEFVKKGCYFSIPAVVVRSKSMKKLVSAVPINQLLTETDSPYLSPKEGERNEPINVSYGLKAISEIHKLSLDKTEEQVFDNFKRLFKSPLIK